MALLLSQVALLSKLTVPLLQLRPFLSKAAPRSLMFEIFLFCRRCSNLGERVLGLPPTPVSHLSLFSLSDRVGEGLVAELAEVGQLSA